MIVNKLVGSISPIALSVLLICYLMVVELGNRRVKKILVPIIVILLVVFGIIFVQNIMSKW